VEHGAQDILRGAAFVVGPKAGQDDLTREGGLSLGGEEVEQGAILAPQLVERLLVKPFTVSFTASDQPCRL
jgi:hypothetical protein